VIRPELLPFARITYRVESPQLLLGACNETSTPAAYVRSLQSRVLRMGLLQDRNLRVGVLPEGEEIFVGGERPDAGGIGVRSPDAPEAKFMLQCVAP
jgi:hypothetical protein